MLDQVRPSLYFWCYLGHFSSIAWLFSSLKMDFLNKITGGLVANIFLRLTIIFSWFVVNVLIYKIFRFFLDKPRANHFFGGYERIGKTVGSALLFFGNIGLYYYSEKSIACMLTFLFLAFYCLCALFCIQPCTDFGVFEFLLSASLNQALSIFGLHSYSTWVVLIACIVMAGLRYWLEPVQLGSNPNLALPVQLRPTDFLPTLENLTSSEKDDHDTNLPTWGNLSPAKDLDDHNTDLPESSKSLLYARQWKDLPPWENSFPEKDDKNTNLPDSWKISMYEAVLKYVGGGNNTYLVLQNTMSK